VGQHVIHARATQAQDSDMLLLFRCQPLSLRRKQVHSGPHNPSETWGATKARGETEGPLLFAATHPFAPPRSSTPSLSWPLPLGLALPVDVLFAAAQLVLATGFFYPGTRATRCWRPHGRPPVSLLRVLPQLLLLSRSRRLPLLQLLQLLQLSQLLVLALLGLLLPVVL